MDNILRECTLCPHKCKVDRQNGKFGKCKAGNKIKIALYSIHKFEEPCISGKNGSGTVFFSNCNLKCVFCQNHEISADGNGKEITENELSDIFLKLQKMGANNINLVTPTIYVSLIIKAIIIAKEKGLNLPIIYNSSGYESIETLKKLDGYINVYLPDFKYFDDDIAYKYSGINNYSKYAKEAITEMYRQVGNPVFNEEQIIQKGVIIRHLILPNNTLNSKKVLKWISENLGKKVYISLMAQYFPTNRSKEFPEINRKITNRELKSVEDYLFNLGFENGYVQKLGKHEEEYVPKFEMK